MAGKPRGIRQEQAARRRTLLLDAALQLFSERGYRDTSVRDLTRAAGVTEAVLYHYFGGKNDILIAVLSEHALFARAGQIIEAAGEAPVPEVLQTLGGEFLRLLLARRQLVLTLLSEAPTNPDLANVLSHFLSGVVDDIAAFLGRRQVRGEIADTINPLAVARAFQGALLTRFLFAAMAQVEGGGSTDDNPFVEDLVLALAQGFARRDGA